MLNGVANLAVRFVAVVVCRRFHHTHRIRYMQRTPRYWTRLPASDRRRFDGRTTIDQHIRVRMFAAQSARLIRKLHVRYPHIRIYVNPHFTESLKVRRVRKYRKRKVLTAVSFDAISTITSDSENLHLTRLPGHLASL